ncbi:MAG: hypothetical protein QY330_03685 [Candidatus Dojkabacteria bacterium]|uniref:Uncharacterized protein n=1 Tax=Candidatus Dojkabacteria bacterium TaxID=2099670 RepID=A0A952DVA6_9BACT|nr:hypothetical protein [Candidatus Dojkabacteria bacterium]WKZ27622.1 MAG: hypothetical protein QY330_03685 [Candidatus Dojkabacteria bacterium]
MQIIITVSIIFGIVSVLMLLMARVWYHRRIYPESLHKKKVLHIKIPPAQALNLAKVKNFFDLLYEELDENSLVSAELIAGVYGMHFLFSCEDSFSTQLKRLLEKSFLGVKVTEVTDYASGLAHTTKIISAAEYANIGNILPIRLFTDKTNDPLQKLFAVLQSVDSPEEVWMEFVFRKADLSKVNIEDIWKELPPLQQRLLVNKRSQRCFQIIIRVLVKTQNRNNAQLLFNEINSVFSRFGYHQFAEIKMQIETEDDIYQHIRKFLIGKTRGERLNQIEKYELRFLPENQIGYFSSQELAALYHFPDMELKSVVPEEKEVEVPRTEMKQESATTQQQVQVEALAGVSTDLSDIKPVEPTTREGDPLAPAESSPSALNPNDYDTFEDS